MLRLTNIEAERVLPGLAGGTAKVTARQRGAGQLKIIEPAPRSCVKLRLDRKKA